MHELFFLSVFFTIISKTFSAANIFEVTWIFRSTRLEAPSRVLLPSFYKHFKQNYYSKPYQNLAVYANNVSFHT